MSDIIFTYSRDDVIKYSSTIALIAIFVASVFVFLLRTRDDRYRNRYNYNSGAAPVSRFKKLRFGIYWLAGPLLVITAAYLIIFSGQNTVISAAARAAIPAFRSDYAKADVLQLLPLHPRNLTEAFILGELSAELKSCAVSDAVCAAGILRRVEALSGRLNVTAEQIIAVSGIVRDIDASTGLLGKFLGAMSFITIVWIIAVIGLAVTLLPFLVYFLGPLMQLLAGLFTGLIVPLLILVSQWVIIPWGGMLLHGLAVVAIVEASRYNLHDSYSVAPMMVCFVAIALSAVGWVYTTTQAPRTGSGPELFLFLSGLFYGTMTALLAIACQSRMLGTVAVAFIICATVWSVFASGLFIFIFLFGHHRNNDILSAISSTLTMSLVLHAARAWGVPSHYLFPFEGPINISCAGIYMTSIAIWCACCNENGLFLINIVGHIVCGLLLGNQPMAIAGGVYGVIYALFFFTWIVSGKFSMVVGAFMTFAVLYAIASAFATRPEIVAIVIYGSAQ